MPSVHADHRLEQLSQATGIPLDQLFERLVVCLYTSGEISEGKAAELLGLDRWSFAEFRAQRRIELPYSVEDLRSDLQTLGTF